jgi:hypothetical protein
MALNYYTQQEYDALSTDVTPPAAVEPAQETPQVDKPKLQYYTEEEFTNLGGVSTQTEQEPIISTEERLQQEPVEPSEPRSRKEMEQDEELMSDIKQHLKDRYDIDADERIPDFFTGYLFGGDEINNEEILEQYMDRWRMMTGNTMDAGFEISWLSDLEDKENAARKAAEAGDDKAAEQANQYAEQRARALRVYQRADEMAGLFGSKRYEGMSTLEAIGEIGETVGVNVVAALSDPVTALTAGAGKIVGLGASASGASLKQAILKAAGTGAALEAVASAGTDVMVQQMEIEMGARDSIDYKRTAAVASIAATTAGVVSGVATRNATTRVDKVTRGELTEALKTQKEAQLKVAKETQKKLRETSTDIREQLAASIEETYGKEAIIRHSNGKVKEINSKFIRESEDANGLYKQVEVSDPDFIDPAMSVNTFERVVASTAELFDGVKKGTIKLTDEITGEPLNKKQLSALTSKLQPGEMVSERMLTILKNTADSETDDIVTQMLGKYGITRREIAAVMFADASKAGQKLNRLSQLSSVIGRAGRIKTAGEAAEEAEAAVADKLGATFRRLEDIRRLTLVSGVATAARNSIGQVIRSGVDTLVYGFDSTTRAINPNKKFGFKNTFAQVSNTFFNSDDSATMAQFLLDHAPEQKARFYNMYSEITNKLAKKNPGQASMASKSNGLQSESPILDAWENVITTVNFFNRFQEAVYRNGAFTTSIQRQLFDKGIDMLDVLKNGTITENIPEDMIAKAVDDALEFTYASQPKTGLFQLANNFIVKSGLTLAMPFPRFMFKAIENTYNYNITGAGTAITRMLLQKSRGQQVTDGMYRQLAEGVAGGMPMITLGYTLRDPENGMAGSEWYMLQDGKGNEFDARPYFPLTPYLLIGEIIHRYTDDRPIPDKINTQELLEGFTGTNFRGAGPIAKMTEDLFKAIETGGDDMGFKYSMATLGEYLGEAISGYGQPLYQFADVEVFGDMNQRKKDYKENPDYKDGVDGFFEGFSRPFEKRIGRIFENYSDMMSDKPDMEDPRFADPQNRVMPFMKLMFGATFTRVPPKYVLDLNRMGFSYRDFTTSTDTPSLNRNMNREMGYMMNMEMPEYLKTLREEYKDQPDAEKMVANGVKQYISSTKSLLYKFEQTKDDQSGQAALMNKYKRMSPYARIAAMQQYKKRFGDEEPTTVEDWMELNNMAAQIRTNVKSIIGR